MVPVGWYKFPAFYSLAAPSRVLHFRRIKRTQQESNPERLNSNILPQPTEESWLGVHPYNKITSYTWTACTLVGHDGPMFLVSCYYSVHPRKRWVVLSQLPHVLWTSGCWHYEWTLYSRRPLKGIGVSIYLSVHQFHGFWTTLDTTFINRCWDPTWDTCCCITSYELAHEIYYPTESGI
jgi:hypothetical protein